MELRTIATFLRVAELQSFSRAAEQLGYSQSAVTVQIRQLEQELQTQLFERIGKHVRLTEDGLRLIPRARDILNAVRAAQVSLREPGQPMGRLRIGTAESLLNSVLPPVLLTFSRRCPLVELSTCTGSTQELTQMVRENQVDLIYFLDQKTNFPEWIKAGERRERAFFVSSARHPLASQRAIPLERLLREPLLLTEKGISYRYAMEQLLAAQGVELHPVLETGNTDVIIRLLEETGVSFLPEFAIREGVRAGRLAILDALCPEIQMWSQLAYHRNKWVTPQMELLLRLIGEQLRTD